VDQLHQHGLGLRALVHHEQPGLHEVIDHALDLGRVLREGAQLLHLHQGARAVRGHQAQQDRPGELLRRGLPPERAQLLARFTGGRLGTALRLEAEPEQMERRAGLLEDMQTLLAGSVRERFAYAEKLAKAAGRENLRDALLVWLSLWRDVLLCASGSDLPPANSDLAGEVERLARTLGFAEARRCALAAERALTGLDMNLNVRLLAEVTLLDWPRVR